MMHWLLEFIIVNEITPKSTYQLKFLKRYALVLLVVALILGIVWVLIHSPAK